MFNRDALLARVVRIFGTRIMTRVTPDLRFPEISGRTGTARVPTRAGEVTCTIYRPPTTSQRPPVYVNFHGGGFIVAHSEQDDHLCRYIAADAGCVVVNVEYDVAPRHPYPTAPIQAYDVTAWVARTGAENDWDGDRLAVGGHSAGANLATGVCLTARDRGDFTPRLQILDYPPLDLAADPYRKRKYTARPLISPGLATIFTGAYLPDPATRREPLASPAFAPDLAGLPPALVITAEFDLLRDEGGAYVKALLDAGVPVSHHMFQGVDHYFTHTGPAPAGREAIALMAGALRKALLVTPPG